MTFFIFIILFISSVLESTILSFPLTVILVTVFAIIYGSEIAVAIFFVGILLSLFNLQIIGGNSLFFLSILWLIIRYQKKVHLGAVVYPIAFFLVANTAYGYIFYRQISPLTIVLEAVLGTVMLLLFSRFFPERVKDNKKLSI